MFFLLFILSFFTTTVLAGDRSSSSRAHTQHKYHRRTYSPTRTFKLVDLYQGQNFLEYVRLVYRKPDSNW